MHYLCIGLYTLTEVSQVSHPHALKGQKLLAQGSALGIQAISKAPCKGKSFVYCLVFEGFCPYRATDLHPSLPRAMPWARSFCPFRACGAYLRNLNTLINIDRKKQKQDRMNIIEKYFPHLTDEQKKQFAALDGLYRDWNAKINVISRKDIDNLYEHHVLHSLAIAKAINFRPGSEILDFGCGGGFPGIPLAILFPECKFKLIDGTGKKIKVCNEVAGAIGLKNLVAEHLRGEDEKGKYDFVVSRAVMQLPDLMKIIKKNFKKAGQNDLPNGLLCLKGGNLKEELKQYYKISEITPLSTFFDEEWFSQDKQLVYVPA